MSLRKWLGQRSPADQREKVQYLPENLWTKCPRCSQLVYHKELEANLWVCARCGFHFRLGARERLRITVDEGSFEETDAGLHSCDPLQFPEYAEKLSQDQARLEMKDALLTGTARVEGYPVVLGIMDIHFRGGSMGCVVGEKVARAMERAMARRQPLILFCASGGARMQEGLLSLMQMAKTSAVASRLQEAGIPYISVLTDPTLAGVSASFAWLADIILAEPGAEIGFTGRRVIEQNLRIELPPDSQTAEFQLAHGMIDLVVPRPQIRSTLASLLRCLVGPPPAGAEAETEA
jgi:acetyl-CoA carboxylase carboxyl transferase subunit beta